MLQRATLVTAAIACLALVSQPAVSQPAAARPVDLAPAAATASAITLEIAPTQIGPVNGDSPLGLTVTISNTSQHTTDTGQINVYLSTAVLGSRQALSEWLRPKDGAQTLSPGDAITETSAVRLVATLPTVTVSTGVSSFPVEVPKEALNLPAPAVFGVAADFTAAGGVLASGRNSIVTTSKKEEEKGATAKSVGLTVAMPLTPPAGTTGLIADDDLAAYTAADGILTKQLDSAIHRQVVIGIDPMILASIRILGGDAPVSATDWLARLEAAPNQTFPLSYADSDIALQAQAAGSLLRPTAFDYAVDPDRFAKQTSKPVTPTPTNPSPSATGASGAPVTSAPPGAPSSPPTGGLPPVPTLASLTAWPYTMAGIGWPADATVTEKDLGVFGNSDIDTTILSGSNVHTAVSAHAPGALGTIAGASVLVADTGVTDAFRAAVAATTERAWSQAMSELAAQLALIAGDGGGESRTLLATLGRDGTQMGRLGQTMDALGNLPWVRRSSLTQALATEPSTAYSMNDHPESQDRVGVLGKLRARAGQVKDFATVVSDPQLITGRYRADMLALLATSWIAQPRAFDAAVQASLDRSKDLLDDVRIGAMSPVQMLGERLPIPITVINDLPYPVTVRVQTVPLNGRVTVDGDVTAQVEAASQAKVPVPVTARVANGEVTLRVDLFNDDMSVQLDGPKYVSVSVRADWETVGTLIVGVLVVGFFGFGLWRNISRRRQLSRREASSGNTPPRSQS